MTPPGVSDWQGPATAVDVVVAGRVAARYLIARDRTYPNEWLIRLADRRCGLGGALERTIDEERRRWYAEDPRG